MFTEKVLPRIRNIWFANIVVYAPGLQQISSFLVSEMRSYKTLSLNTSQA
jgi:hypothetical protein